MGIYDLDQTDISTETLSTDNGESIHIVKYHFLFTEWNPQNSYDTYGGKVILDYTGEPLFAGLLVLRLFEQLGFKGFWVDTYRNKFWQRLPQVSFPVINRF